MERLYDFFGIYVVPRGFYMSLFVLIRILSTDVTGFKAEVRIPSGGGANLDKIRGLDVQQ